MKKIVNKRYLETYYEETLENGLHVILWERKNFQKSLFMMATPFGAVDLNQRDEHGNEYEFPAGIAHFLEHKMFAMQGQDVMEMFSSMGANVNAFTSYHETCYYTSTSDDPIKPLHLLLDFVQELDIDEASVEKEKGIIIQELHMYKEMSDQCLLMETYSSLYQNHPLKEDIGGDDDSVRSISVEMLKECYELNYHPSRMILFGVTGSDPEQIMEEVRKNQANKQFSKRNEVTTHEIDEPRQVARPHYDFQMEVSKPKVSVTYKLEGVVDPYERTRKEWALRLLLDANFSTLYPEYQTWIDQEIINDYCGCDSDLGEDYGNLMFYCETEHKDTFIELCKECVERMKRMEITEAVLEQLKRRYFGQSIRAMNDFDDIAISYIRSYFAEMDYFQSLDLLDSLTMKDIKDAVQLLEREEIAIVELLPKK